jgi:glycerol-3-phosphate dehydrogenase
MVVHLDDLLRRRLPLLILTRLDAALLHDLAQTVAALQDWDATRTEAEIRRCQS